MTDKEFASNRTLVGILHTIIVGTSVFSLAAWWLQYMVVFYICASICTLITLTVTFLVAYYSVDGIHFIFVDGKLVTFFADKHYPRNGPGHFGFGIYESHAEYSNLTVYRPFWTPLTPSYKH